MKLQSMTDRVLQLAELRYSDINDNEYIEKSINHANFLKLPLTLSMFIPTDENGNVLEEPKKYTDKNWTEEQCSDFGARYIEFQQAKYRVIFEGLVVEKKADYYVVTFNDFPIWVSWNNSKTIEDLIDNNLTITETAVKKYGL